jgi:hypothetical protein
MTVPTKACSVGMIGTGTLKFDPAEDQRTPVTRHPTRKRIAVREERKRRKIS